MHGLAAGRPSRNLDAWLLPEPALLAVLRRGARGADLALIEGVMGLFDGIGSSQAASTAAVARALDCPVLLVLDVFGMSTTAAALALGCQRMEPGVRLAGVILNRVGSDAHYTSTAEAIRQATGLPTLGYLPHDASLAMPERHLGLVPAAEAGLSPATLERLTDQVLQHFDVAAIRGIAESAPALPEASEARVEPVILDRPVRVGVAQDRAFGFYYADTFDILAELGAEVVPFSALDDQVLPPDVNAVYLGGGFPELYAAEIAANGGMRQAFTELARRGAPIYAECGGLMALGEALVTFDGERLPGFGLLPLVSRMTREHLTIGYREVEAIRPTALLDRAERIRGHEFHWSTADPPPADLAAYRLLPDGPLEGYSVGSILASYVHLSFAGSPRTLARFVRTAARAREWRSARTSCA